jgi:outer membrane protein insertion porin family
VASTTRIFTEDKEEFNKDFGTRTYGASQDFSKSFMDQKILASLGFVYEYREQYLSQDRALEDFEKEDYVPRNILVVSPGLIYRTTDSYVRPRKGVFSSVNMDISKGIENDLDDFIKYRLAARYYYTLFEPLTLAVRGRYGLIQPYGGNTHVPEDQLFYLGGTSTVRGFDENMLRIDADGQAAGGRQMMLGAIEARYDLGMNLELTLFYDIGTVIETQNMDVSTSFRDSVGIGLRYMTPIGPIGFLYGHKLDPYPTESPGSFHFSMGYTF